MVTVVPPYAAAVPVHEAERISALAHLRVLGKQADERVQQITRLAATLLHAPVSLVTLVDGDRQHYYAAYGVEGYGTPREEAFCGHTILQDDVFVIEDAREDPRFANHPDVEGGLGIRFYAGAPLRTYDGYNVGSVCVLDHTPRTLKDDERASLRLLATMVVDEMERAMLTDRLLNEVVARRAAEADLQTQAGALRKSEATLGAAFHNAPIGMALVAPDGTYLRVNRSLCRMVGYQEAELLALSYRDITHPDDRSENAALVAGMIAGNNAPRFVEKRYLHKDGRILWVDLSVSLVRDDEERPLYFISQLNDITARKQAEAALQHSAHRLREAQEMARMGSWEYSLVTGGVTWSEGMLRLFNVTVETAPRNLREVLAVMPGPHRDAVKHTLRTGEPYRIEHEITYPGCLPLHLMAAGEAVMEGAQVVALRGTVVDITEQKAAEQALAEAKAQAEQAAQTKASFLATMSHEIRTPLNGILGYTEVLEQSDLSDEQVAAVTTIRSCGDGLLQIVNDVLDFSKIEAGALKFEQVPFEVSEVVMNALRIVSVAALRKGVSLTQTIYVPDIPVVGDPHRIGQVLLNLLSNAVKFTHEGGVNVEVRQTRTPGGHELRFAVSDTGVGIPPEKAATIFQPFAQADSSTSRHYGGTGLGLSISQRLATLMGGTLSAASEVGHGSTFTLTIPVGIVPAPSGRIPSRRTRRPSAPEAPAPLNTLRVLLAEDNAINRKVALNCLARLGIEAVAVEDGQAAVEAALKQPFDVILMDLHMPRLGGLEAAARIRAEGPAPGPRIVALTGDAMPETITAMGQAGFDGFVAKPFKFSALQAALQPAAAASTGKA